MSLTVHDLMLAPPPPKADEYIIYPWLQPGRLLLMVGPTEGGKTTLTLDMIAAALRGSLLFNRYPTKQIHRVLYLHAEHSLATVQEIAQKRSDIPTEHVFVIHEFGTFGTALIEGTRPNITLLRELSAVCTDIKPQLIIAEPISAFLSTSENDNKEARQLIQILSGLGAKHGAAVLTHHHVGKSFFDPDRIRPKGLAIGEARGAMAFEDASERVIYLRPDKTDTRIETVKPKGYPVSPFQVSRDIETLVYHLTNPFDYPQDVIGVFGCRLNHPGIPREDLAAILRGKWGCTLPIAQSLIHRAVVVGLLTDDDAKLPPQYQAQLASIRPHSTALVCE